MTFDPGLQPERTSLAWNRTALSMVVGGFAGLRVLPDLVGDWGLAVALVVIVAGGAVGITAHRRTERGTRALVSGEGTLPDARLLFGVSSLVAVVAAVGIVTVVVAAVVR